MLKLFDEILELRNDISHRSVLRIYSILDSNKEFFCSKMDKDNFNSLLKSYEEFAHGHPGRVNTSEFKYQYSKLFESLAYNINKII